MWRFSLWSRDVLTPTMNGTQGFHFEPVCWHMHPQHSASLVIIMVITDKIMPLFEEHVWWCLADKVMKFCWGRMKTECVINDCTLAWKYVWFPTQNTWQWLAHVSCWLLVSVPLTYTPTNPLALKKHNYSNQPICITNTPSLNQPPIPTSQSTHQQTHLP